jgi:hypothetical protein
MNDKEYRKLAFFVFPMLENLLHNLSKAIQILDNETYSDRITERKEKRGKKMVTVIGNIPLSQEQIYNYVESKGYISTLVAIRSIIDRLTSNAWDLEQVADFIHLQPEELQENIWMLYKFENCKFDNPDNTSIVSKLESCKAALEHCEQFMSGDRIMDKINSMFGYVLVQVNKNINYILGGQ